MNMYTPYPIPLPLFPGVPHPGEPINWKLKLSNMAMLYTVRPEDLKGLA